MEFRNVNVSAGEVITITVKPGAIPNLAALSGLQITDSGLFPFIDTPLANQEVFEGASATFSVDADGLPPLAYQWLFNSAAIASATNSSYTLSNVQSSNAGNYSVVLSNAYGSVTSLEGTLTVITPLVTGIARNSDGTITLDFTSLGNSTARIWTATNLSPPVYWTPIFTNKTVGADGQWQGQCLVGRK